MVANLRKLRKELGLSQQKLAEHFGISQQSIYKYENGLAEPDIAMLICMADYFCTSVDYLIGRIDENSLQTLETMSTKEIRHMKMYRKLSKSLKTNIDSIIMEFSSRI